jgi:lipopolysaccharide transport system permease protein
MLLYQRESWFTLLNPVSITADLYRHRVLLWQFICRNIELQHKGSFLGIAWSMLSPLLLFAVYAFVFLIVFDGRFGVVPTETRADFAIGLFLGLSLAQLFQETLTTAPLLVVQNPNYVKKVVFPLEILPVAAVGAALFRCLVSLGLVVLAGAIWGPGIALTACWLPVIVGLLVLLSLGVAWTLSALGVFLRDLAQLAQFFAVLLTFMSGIFYSLGSLPASFSFLSYNPLLVLIDAGRNVLLWHRPPSVPDLTYVGLVSVLLCLIGHLIFAALKPAFSDVL